MVEVFFLVFKVNQWKSEDQYFSFFFVGLYRIIIIYYIVKNKLWLLSNRCNYFGNLLKKYFEVLIFLNQDNLYNFLIIFMYNSVYLFLVRRNE